MDEKEKKYWIGRKVTRRVDGMEGEVIEYLYSGGMWDYAGLRIRWSDGTEEDCTDSRSPNQFH